MREYRRLRKMFMIDVEEDVDNQNVTFHLSGA